MKYISGIFENSDDVLRKPPSLLAGEKFQRSIAFYVQMVVGKRIFFPPLRKKNIFYQYVPKPEKLSQLQF